MIKINFNLIKSNLKTIIFTTLILSSTNSLQAFDIVKEEDNLATFSTKTYKETFSKDKFSISLSLNNTFYILELEENKRFNKNKFYSDNEFSLLKGKIKNINDSWVFH